MDLFDILYARKMAGSGGSGFPIAVDISDLTWENVTGNDVTGEIDSPRNDRLSCTDYVDIPANAAVFMADIEGSNNQGFYHFTYFYGDKDFISGTGWVQNGTAETIPNGTKTLRIGLKKSDGANINKQELETAIITFR